MSLLQTKLNLGKAVLTELKDQIYNVPVVFSTQDLGVWGWGKWLKFSWFGDEKVGFCIIFFLWWNDTQLNGMINKISTNHARFGIVFERFVDFAPQIVESCFGLVMIVHWPPKKKARGPAVSVSSGYFLASVWESSLEPIIVDFVHVFLANKFWVDLACFYQRSTAFWAAQKTGASRLTTNGSRWDPPNGGE